MDDSESKLLLNNKVSSEKLLKEVNPNSSKNDLLNVIPFDGINIFEKTVSTKIYKAIERRESKKRLIQKVMRFQMEEKFDKLNDKIPNKSLRTCNKVYGIIIKTLAVFSILWFILMIGVIHYCTYRTLMGQGFDTAGSNETAAFLNIFMTMTMYTTGGITLNEIVDFMNDKFKAGLRHVKQKKKN